MMEMNWPQHKWRIHLHWSGLLMMTHTTCCAWQVYKQLHVHCLWCVSGCSWHSVIVRLVYEAAESDCWFCVCPARGMSRLLPDGFLWNLILWWILTAVEKIHVWLNADESNGRCRLDAAAALTWHCRLGAAAALTCQKHFLCCLVLCLMVLSGGTIVQHWR
jgi:hypothetical protein